MHGTISQTSYFIAEVKIKDSTKLIHDQQQYVATYIYNIFQSPSTDLEKTRISPSSPIQSNF